MAELGHTDTTAGAALGVSQPTITRWRLGRNRPSAAQIPATARFLGISQTALRAAIDASPPTERPAHTGTLGALLRTIEVDRGLTATDAWTMFGIDKSRYYRYRSDTSVPALAELPRLAARFGVPEEQLVLAVYRTELARSG